MNAEAKIFRAFHELNQPKLYFSQLKDHTKLSNSSLQNVLQHLEKGDILRKEETKANTFFSIKDARITALRFAEQDIERFNGLNRMVRLPLLDFIKKLPPQVFTVILFGSAARKTEGKSSDIDLLVILHKYQDLKLQEAYDHEVGKAVEQAKKDAGATTIHAFSIVFATIENYKKKDDHLLEQARTTGFPIINQQTYYEAMQNKY